MLALGVSRYWGSSYLSNGKADEFPSRAEMLVVTSDDGEHESADEEALNLDPATAQDLDEIDGEEVARYVAGCCDDEISVGVLEQSVVLGLPFRKPDGAEQNGLVEIETVEGYIDQEPCRCGTDQGLQVAPLTEVGEECLHLDISGRWSNVGFDDGCVSVTVDVQSVSLLNGPFVHACNGRGRVIDLRGFECAEFVRLQKLPAFRHPQAIPKSNERGYYGDSDLQSPHCIELTVVTCLQCFAEAAE